MPVWREWQAEFSSLSEHAVDSRYPGKFATEDDTARAMQICNEVRQAVREQLKLPLDTPDN